MQTTTYTTSSDGAAERSTVFRGAAGAAPVCG